MNRQAFTGHHRLVDIAIALFNQTVNGNLGSWTNQKKIADRNVGGWNLKLLAVAHHDGLWWCEIDQGSNRLIGAAAGSHFEPMAEENKRRQHGSSLIKDIAPSGKGYDQRIQPSGGDCNRDQHHHVERACPQRAHCSVEEDPSRPEHDRNAENQLQDIVTHSKRRADLEAEDITPDGRPQNNWN